MRSQVIIWATLALNAVLFTVNAAVALESDSHAVLSQAVYTVTDLVGGLFLVWGSYQSQRPPDYDHPFGYGKERFFWSFSASLVTFSVAGIIVLVSGLEQVFSPQPVGHLNSALIVVAGTLVASLAGIWVTLRELRRSRETVETLLASSHMGLKTIFLQDLVSVFGAVVALAGLAVVYRSGSDVADGLSACVVGVLLIGAGFVLAGESRELLVGKAIPPAQARELLGIVERDARVRRVRRLQSMMLGPEDILLALQVNFQDGLTTDEIEAAIDQLSSALRVSSPALKHLIIEPES